MVFDGGIETAWSNCPLQTCLSRSKCPQLFEGREVCKSILCGISRNLCNLPGGSSPYLGWTLFPGRLGLLKVVAGPNSVCHVQL